jgi:hypothetical protein
LTVRCTETLASMRGLSGQDREFALVEYAWLALRPRK